MANDDSTPQQLTPDTKLKIYELLAGTNRGFLEITDTCRALQETAVFDSQKISDFQGLTWELQSEINSHILAALLTLEQADAHKYEKVRLERERKNKGE